MSWSISFIGKPENVVKALNEQSDKLTGDSKAEFDAALPHIVGLINKNYGNSHCLLNVSGNGHAYKSGESDYSNLNIKIEQIAGVLV